MIPAITGTQASKKPAAALIIPAASAIQETIGLITIVQMQRVATIPITPPIDFSPKDSFIPFISAHKSITAITEAAALSGVPVFPPATDIIC